MSKTAEGHIIMLGWDPYEALRDIGREPDPNVLHEIIDILSAESPDETPRERRLSHAGINAARGALRQITLEETRLQDDGCPHA